jgi:hypothetical protein
MDMRELRRAAQDQGWETGRTRKGHHRWVPPDPAQPIVFGSGTPGDRRAIKNFLSELRQSGFIWPWPPDQATKEHDDQDDGMER